jgi:thioredoxin reductase (NADPH)
VDEAAAGSGRDEPKPAFLVVSDDPALREGLVADLDRRFGRDYEVAGSTSVEAGGALSAAGDPLALLLVDERVRGSAPKELFARGRERHPAVKRVLLVHRGNWSSVHPVVAAMALGQVDYHLYVPWVPIERILYPAISDFLAAWDTSRDAPVVPLTIVGLPRDARSHDIRDKLARAAIPFRFTTRTAPRDGGFWRRPGGTAPGCRSSPPTPARCWTTRPTPTWSRRWA